MRRTNSVIFITMLFAAAIMLAAGQSQAAGHLCPPGGGTSEDPCSAEANLTLSGTVQRMCSIEIEADTKASELDIKNGENNTLVATANIEANGDYEVTVLSANGGELKNGLVAEAAGVPYQISFGGGAMVAPTTEAQQVKDSGPVVGVQSVQEEIRVTFAGAGSAAPGTYSDDLTFRIQAL